MSINIDTTHDIQSDLPKIGHCFHDDDFFRLNFLELDESKTNKTKTTTEKQNIEI